MSTLVNVMRTIRPSDWGYHLYNRQGGHEVLPTDQVDYFRGSASALNTSKELLRLSVYLNCRSNGETDEEALLQANDVVERFDDWRHWWLPKGTES